MIRHMSQIIEVPRSHPLGQGYRFSLPQTQSNTEIACVAVRIGIDSWIAMQNRCRHWSEPLDTDSPSIYNAETGEIRCSIHGAHFSTENGECKKGPCLGAFLKMLEIINQVDGTTTTRLEIRNPWEDDRDAWEP